MWSLRTDKTVTGRSRADLHATAEAIGSEPGWIILSHELAAAVIGVRSVQARAYRPRVVPLHWDAIERGEAYG